MFKKSQANQAARDDIDRRMAHKKQAQESRINAEAYYASAEDDGDDEYVMMSDIDGNWALQWRDRGFVKTLDSSLPEPWDSTNEQLTDLTAKAQLDGERISLSKFKEMIGPELSKLLYD